jgi:hypothetical protein
MLKRKRRKQDGYDIVFMLCSQDCAVALREALQTEKEMFGGMRTN